MVQSIFPTCTDTGILFIYSSGCRRSHTLIDNWHALFQGLSHERTPTSPRTRMIPSLHQSCPQTRTWSLASHFSAARSDKPTEPPQRRTGTQRTESYPPISGSEHREHTNTPRFLIAHDSRQCEPASLRISRCNVCSISWHSSVVFPYRSGHVRCETLC